MQTRQFGRGGLELSVLGFGCGSVGGLMVRGNAADQERTVARAIEAGITYFDTAAQYGNGASETSLGAVLRRLKPRHVTVGTKVKVQEAERGDISKAIIASLDASLRRLGRDSVDIFHLHNPITEAGDNDTLTAEQVLREVVPVFDALRQQGKIRLPGITAVGDVKALRRVLDTKLIASAQVSYNMLNPSAATGLPANYPAQDYGGLFASTQAAGTGVIGIRVLAGGALAGTAERQPNASPPPKPIGSATSFDADLARARRFMPLIEAGFADSLAELAARFVMSNASLGTMLIGIATSDELEQALAAVQKGPLPEAALVQIKNIQAGFAGEPR